MRLTEEELTRELRAIRPEIDPEFSAQLDAWAAEGFPSAKQFEGKDAAPSRLRERLRRFHDRPLLPALAGAATIVLAVTISVGVWQAGRDEATDLSLEPEMQQLDGGAERAQESGGDASVIAPEPVPPIPPSQRAAQARRGARGHPRRLDEALDGARPGGRRRRRAWSR